MSHDLGGPALCWSRSPDDLGTRKPYWALARLVPLMILERGLDEDCSFLEVGGLVALDSPDRDDLGLMHFEDIGYDTAIL